MKLEKCSIILYSIDQIFGEPWEGRNYTKGKLSNALGISPSTLDLYLTRLKKEGALQRSKRKYVSDIRKVIELTREGKERLRAIKSIIDQLILTEERHNIPSRIHVSTVLKRMSDPMERVFFVSLYTMNRSFDLPLYMKTMGLMREETNLLNMFDGLDKLSSKRKRGLLIEPFFNASLYGQIDKELLSSDVWRKEDIDSLILLAEAKMRMGKLDEARMIHGHLLRSRTDLTKNQYFMVRIGQAQVLDNSGETLEAVRSVSDLIGSMDSKVHISYAKTIKAFLLFQAGDRKEYKELYKSSINHFSVFGLPLFLSISYNYSGMTNFMLDDLDAAENDWVKARRFARRAKSLYAEAKVMTNLADIAMKRKKYDLSMSYLKRADSIFEDCQDHEGRAVIEFNLSLLSLEMGEPEQAVLHFNRCKEIAFPLPSPRDLKVFREEVVRRACEKGFTDMENII